MALLWHFFITAEKYLKKNHKNSSKVFKYIMIHNPRVLSGWQYNENYKNYLVTRESVLELYDQSRNIQIMCFI